MNIVILKHLWTICWNLDFDFMASSILMYILSTLNKRKAGYTISTDRKCFFETGPKEVQIFLYCWQTTSIFDNSCSMNDSMPGIVINGPKNSRRSSQPFHIATTTERAMAVSVLPAYWSRTRRSISNVQTIEVWTAALRKGWGNWDKQCKIKGLRLCISILHLPAACFWSPMIPPSRCPRW